jgi:hypothetical protein
VTSKPAKELPEGDAAAPKGSSVSRWGLAGVVALLVLFAAWRSSLGLSFADDAYYVAASLRLAQGARIFADEMFVQSLGFLIAAPFVKVWTMLFGTTGLILALKLFYVVLASAAGAFVYRALRPSFGPWVSLAATAAPLLAPPYNLLSVSYDTMAVLGLMLGCALAFAAVRDTSRASGVAAGVALAVATISYPPLVLASIVVLICVAIVGRGGRTAAWIASGAAVIVALFAVWLLTRVPVGDIVISYHYILSMGHSSAGGRLVQMYRQMVLVMGRGWRAPLWAWFIPALALSVAGTVAGAVRRGPSRWNSIAIAAMPVAVAMPVIGEWGAHGFRTTGWTVGANYLIALVVALFPLILVRVLRRPDGDERLLLAVTAPASLLGFVVVAYLTSAGQYWGSAVVGLAPLAMVSVAIWARSLGEAVPPAGQRVAVCLLLVLLSALLVGVSFKDAPPWGPKVTLRSGPAAGMTASESHAARIAAAERLIERWTRPGTGVLFVGYPLGYVQADVAAVTNAAWLNIGPGDQATIDYYVRTGRSPDVAFVSTSLVTPNGSPEAKRGADPLLDWLAARYRTVGTDAGLTAYVRR